MLVKPLSINEIASNGGYTHLIVVTANDLTETTTNTAQAITLMTIATGDVMRKCEDNVAILFQDASDAAFNVTTRSLGDNSAVTTHTAAAEANANGTPVTKKIGSTAVLYTAANTFKVNFVSMSGKALNDIDAGELHILVAIERFSQITNATPPTAITK